MAKLAARFGVSDSYLARICVALNIPRPGRGYWRKLEVGKAAARPALPVAKPGDPTFWSKDDEQISAPKSGNYPRSEEGRRSARASKNSVHSLLHDAEVHFEKGYSTEEGTYLKPYKKLMADVTASRSGLCGALALANQLYKAFEAAGHRVIIAKPGGNLFRAAVDERELTGRPRPLWDRNRLWSPARPTVVYIGTVPIGLAVVEISECVMLHYLDGKYLREREYRQAPHRFHHHSWTTERDIPSGRYRIVAYAPYERLDWSQQWQQTKTSSLKHSINSIVETVERVALKLAEMLEHAERQAESERQRSLAALERARRDEDQRRVAQSVQDSKAELAAGITRWGEIIRIEQFLSEAERRIAGLDQPERQELQSRLRLAREFIGGQDPLDILRHWLTPRERYLSQYDSEGRSISG